MDFFASILNFLIDKEKKGSIKTLFIICILIILYFLNNTLGFTYHYNISRKLEEIQKVNEILKEPDLPISIKANLLVLRDNIINHQSWVDEFWDYAQKLLTSETVSKNDVHETVSRNFIWQFISSSFFVLIGMIAIPIYFIRKKTFKTFSGFFIILFILWALMFFYAVIVALLLSLIPIIAGRPYINYIVNIILNLAVPILIGLYMDWREKRKKKNQAVISVPEIINAPKEDTQL